MPVQWWGEALLRVYHEDMVYLPERLGLTLEDVVFPPERNIVAQMDFRFLVHEERLDRVRSWKGWRDGLKVEDFSMILLGGRNTIRIQTVFHCGGNPFEEFQPNLNRPDREYRRWWRNQFKNENQPDT